MTFVVTSNINTMASFEEIVLINDYAHVNGGASQVAVSSALGLASRGHRVRFFAAVGPADKRLAAAGVGVVCTGQPDLLSHTNLARAAVLGIWNRTARNALGELLAPLSPSTTVVHVHLWYKALSSSIIREVLKRGFRVVVTLHDYTAVCPNGSFYNYQTKSICRLRPLGGQCLTTNCDPRGATQKAWRILRNLVQSRMGRLPWGVDRLVCVSEASHAIFREHLPMGVPVKVIPNPIDMPQGEPVSVGQNSEFLFVGRLTEQKGPELLAEAGRELGVPVVFAGDGELSEVVKACNPSATITGWLDRAGTRARLQGARALVFPSRCYETQGIAVAEAAALGIPAIVPRSSTACDLVVDGETGFWFRDGDSKDLAQKMRLLVDPLLAVRLGREAHRRYWKKPMTLDVHIDKLESLYSEMINDGLRLRP
jgi:glycosyltransferase involved in cell wall biosynthesis